MNSAGLLVITLVFCFVHGQGQRTQKIENKNIHKEPGEFHNQSRFIKCLNLTFLQNKLLYLYKKGTEMHIKS